MCRNVVSRRRPHIHVCFCPYQYGFTKVRRGPETDMYAHSSFLRDQPKSLLNLRKLTPANRKRLHSDASHTTHTTAGSTSSGRTPRPVSPSSNSHQPDSPLPRVMVQPPVPKSLTLSLPGKCDRGKLDLLALAMEREFAARS